MCALSVKFYAFHYKLLALGKHKVMEHAMSITRSSITVH